MQEIPRAQVAKRIRVNIVETIPQERVQQRTVEQIVRVPVPTVQKQMCVPVKSGAQVMERIPEHIVESLDQEELDQLRHDWLMGAFEHPDFWWCCRLLLRRDCWFTYTVLRSAICLQSLLERHVGTRSLGDPQPFCRRILDGSWLCGFVVWRHGTMRRSTFRQATLNQTKTRVQTRTRKLWQDTVGDPLNGHIWPCFVKYEAHCDLQHRVWVSHCCASNPNEVHFECGLRELLVLFQCLAFSVWSWWIKSLILWIWNLTGMIIRSSCRVQKIWLTELNLLLKKKRLKECFWKKVFFKKKMTHRIELFSNTTHRIELFSNTTQRIELSFRNMTQRTQLFFLRWLQEFF